MKNVAILLAFLTLLASFPIDVASDGQADEIVVTIPVPTPMVKLPSGAMCAQLSREDVEYAKSESRKAYRQAKTEGVERPVVVQLPGGVFQLAEPIVLG